MKHKKTVVFDFDGVIHSYKSGWQGEANISDKPVDGIADVLHSLQKRGYEVVIVSTRCSSTDGRTAIENWLYKNNLLGFVDKVCKEKPPAVCYVDDRAIRFDGNVDELVDEIENFKSWVEE